jgi:hypothetical protein
MEVEDLEMEFHIPLSNAFYFNYGFLRKTLFEEMLFWGYFVVEEILNCIVGYTII